MFENFIDEKISAEKNKLKGINISSVSDIKKAPLLPFIKTFIIKQIQPDFTLNDVYFLLEKAVKLNFNYTIRPKWTLMKYLFNNYDSQRINTVLKKMEVFLYYRFYTDLIAKFIDENTHIFISRKQAEELIEETDIVMLEKLEENISSVKVKNFFIQLFRLKYDKDSEINLESTVSFVFVKIFLQDKGYYDVLRQFHAKNKYNDESEISLKDIIKTMTGQAVMTELAETKSEPTEKVFNEPSNEIINEVDTVEPSVIDEEVQIKDNDNPNDEKIIVDFEDENDTERAEDTRTEKINSTAQTESIEIGEEADRNIYSEELAEAGGIEEKSSEGSLPEYITGSDAETAGEETVDSIKKLFTSTELQDICKKIYNGKKNGMNESILKLEKMESWEEAIEYLKKVFLNNDVDPYQKNVVLYVDVLSEYFANKQEEN